MSDYIIRSLRVFLCHASNDKPDVQKLYSRLTNDGIDAWLDREKLLPGQNWRTEIQQAVRNSDAVIVCVSSRSITKEGFVQKEIKIALDAAEEKPEGTIFIIPARLENCDVPERIGQYQWVDLFSDDGYERLLRALQLRANAVGAILKPFKSEQSSTINNREQKSLSTERYDLFLSYSTANKDVARVIFDFFTAKKLNVFVSEKAIQPNSKWNELVRSAFENSRLLCLLISPDSLLSRWLITEVNSAEILKIPIVAILYRCWKKDLPEELLEYQNIDYHEYAKIINILGSLLK